MIHERSVISENEPFASIHIPKTGGTSLREFYGKLYGLNNVLRYSIESNKFHRLSEDGVLGTRTNPTFYQVRDILVKSELGRILYKAIRNCDATQAAKTGHEVLPTDFKVVHGHFQPSKVTDQIGNIKLVTVIREPLERALSGYYYLKKLEKSAQVNGILPKWYQMGMPLEEFLFLPENTNYQINFLEGKPISEFSIVGTTDNLDHFCSHISHNSSARPQALNATTRPPLNLDRKVIEEFARVNKEDYDLYNYVKEHNNY